MQSQLTSLADARRFEAILRSARRCKLSIITKCNHVKKPNAHQKDDLIRIFIRFQSIEILLSFDLSKLKRVMLLLLSLIIPMINCLSDFRINGGCPSKPGEAPWIVFVRNCNIYINPETNIIIVSGEEDSYPTTMPTADIHECPPSPPCPPPQIPPAPPLPPSTPPTTTYYIPPAPPLPPPGYLLPNYTGPCPIPKPCPPAPPLPPMVPNPTKRPGIVRPSAEEISRATLRKTNFTRRPNIIIGKPKPGFTIPAGIIRPSADEIAKATLRPVGPPNWHERDPRECFAKKVYKRRQKRSLTCFPHRCRNQKLTALEFSQEDSEKCLSSPHKDRNRAVAEIPSTLRDEEKPLCTGAIITRNLVVTSAHCVHWASEQPSSNLQVHFIQIGKFLIFRFILGCCRSRVN